MAYTEEEREQIKIRIIEILRENETMNYQKLANMIIDENLAYSQHVVAHTLQRGCKNHKNYNGEDLFENPSRGLWKLSNKECIFCKMKDYILENELAYATSKPFKLCTFSRVMKEKGIEDAVNAVEEINKKYDETIFTLDIYGQIDAMQTEWFESLQSRFLKDVSYKGLVPFDKSTDVLKNYYALLFPTYYEGEGFAGTLIDAMAAGVPIIASDWRYNSEIVQDNRTGFLIKNSESLHEKLEFIKSNITLVNDMKKICIEEAKEYLPNIAMNKLIKKL